MKSLKAIVSIGGLIISQPGVAQECWALTEIKGLTAFSRSYEFATDGFSKPMVLCFSSKTGSVSGDDTDLVRFGNSTLAGWATNNGVELFEVYQIDRENGRVLFTKSRIGTSTVIPGAPNVVGAFTGTATRVRE